MKKHPRVIFLLIAAWLAASAVFGANRIMLIGDSITDGYFWSLGKGFRDDLYTMIQGSGWPFEFVGSSDAGLYACHYRYGGDIEKFYPNGDADVTSDMIQWKPNIAVVHLGTNDMGFTNAIGPYSQDGGSTFNTSTVSGRMATLLAWLSRWKTGVYGSELEVIFVSQIIPKISSSWESERVVAFNQAVALIVADAQVGNIPSIPPGTLRLVDQYSTFNPGTMMEPGGIYTMDGVHPNNAGYANMAGVLWQALRTLPMKLAVVKANWVGPASSTIGPMEASVTDGFDQPVVGVPVRFFVTAGDAAVIEPDSIFTDNSGLARAMIRLGSTGVSKIQVAARDLVDAGTEFTLTASSEMIVEGVVRYRDSNQGLPDVNVSRLGSVTGTTTDSFGQYRLVVPLDGQPIVIAFTRPKWSGLDSHITEEDAWQAARLASGLASQSPESMRSADVDGDGQVTARDVALLARYAAGFSDLSASRIGGWSFIPDTVSFDPSETIQSTLDAEGILTGDVDGR